MSVGLALAELAVRQLTDRKVPVDGHRDQHGIPLKRRKALVLTKAYAEGAPGKAR